MKDTLSTLDLNEHHGNKITWLQLVPPSQIEEKKAKGWTHDESGPPYPDYWSRIMERPEPYRG